MNLDSFLDYIRVVAYAVVVSSSIVNLMNTKVHKILLVGDIVLGISLMLVLLRVNLGNAILTETADIFLTPAAIIWAVIHFIALLKK